ncbi:MAG: patatin-like phospholipase family protein [Bacteroidota bacterium]|jgi:NTE family protein
MTASQPAAGSACTPEQIAARGNRKPINLALQGGGAHGAFAWGVLDRLLEDDRLAIDAVSATSAGTMNAVALAWGTSLGGSEGARAKLDELWQAVGAAGSLWGPIFSSGPFDKWLALNGVSRDLSPGFLYFQALTHLFSPYVLNPFDFNPLKDLLLSLIDFERLRTCARATRLFVSATNVRTGKIRVFENGELTADTVLASACLPYIFKAVEIDGEAYWDGGFMGNPPLFPLIYRGASRDIVIVHINPLTRPDVPKTAPEIFDRMNEISFNSSLMREMRAIAFVTRLLDEGALDAKRYSRMLIHSIRDDVEMARHGAATKLAPDWDFLRRLRDRGRAAADAWLARNLDKIGRESSLDVAATFL